MALSSRAIEFILGFEVGGEDRYSDRPVWPGGQSGVTIGIGYDLGMHSRDDVDHDWGGELDLLMIGALARCCSVRGMNARALLPSLKTVIVPWDAAVRVWRTIVLPEYEKMTQRIFPHCEQAPADVYGALVDLVFNRGNALDGPERQEMAELSLAIEGGQYADIPRCLRSMARVWQRTPLESAMTARREAEARLAEEGLGMA